MFRDEVELPIAAKEPGGGRAVTVVQGIPAGRHTLEVRARPRNVGSATAGSPVEAVRVYRPPVAAGP
ncbi:hypothetical protein OJF2_26930 [Aquisphaera giovannonii]|uniref:Uncharacterized protein n=1 Tax=Aquisphaera giovannonii TaxID=406548 RepID=A0A5B9W0R9_9BACT|nr:hypothetical protein [Aquisphaera giovannonii]QEH34158.1 hypothetical protein OJF2_26930 [Aquisphaera giovannonii]